MWRYVGTAAQPFFSAIRGKQQPLPNGNVLITEPSRGRVFEITRNEGETVWEYHNRVSWKGGDAMVGEVSEAVRVRYDALEFIDQGGKQ